MRRNPRIYEYYQLGLGQQRRTTPPRIRDSWPLLVLGMFTMFVGILIVIWNEAKAVASARALEESAAAITDIQLNEEIDNALVGKLIYVTGAIVVKEPVTDADYGISVPAVKLKRRVQMFQWIEEEYKQSVHGDSPSSQYFYFTDWRDKIINSAKFSNARNHQNPKDFPIKTKILVNEKVTMGKFELGEALKEKFNKFEEVASDERPESKDVKLHSGLYYHSQDVWNPDVGDLRIQFSYAGIHGQEISVIGKIDEKKMIVPFKTAAGMNLLLMRLGKVPKEDIFYQEHSLNVFVTWIYRVISWFLIYTGSFCITKILAILCQQAGAAPETIPPVKMAMSVSIFLLVTAFAWIWYRPGLGFFLLAGMVGVIYISGYLCERHTQAVYAAYAEQIIDAEEETSTRRHNRQ